MSGTRDYPAFETDQYGLTKRELAAIHIMAGFAAAPDITSDVGRLAECAVKWVDALFDELERGQ